MKPKRIERPLRRSKRTYKTILGIKYYKCRKWRSISNFERVRILQQRIEDDKCCLCGANNVETLVHLFPDCAWTMKVKTELENWSGELVLNKITGDLLNNPDHVLNDNDANRGSKLLTNDGNDGSYRVMQGIPRSKIFHSISNLYKCTTRLSPVENEYIWNLRDNL
ncbi:hypothetical protein H5410_000637 [Solanum commersonii]|uniref:Uncharacterized protein n=1 Tax=Solanum commersonii TaxID=4109 RepID=A0A9J6AWS0_SOLCO|nr:hypothetical protein H5410_000637 [Solanum commersonii]